MNRARRADAAVQRLEDTLPGDRIEGQRGIAAGDPAVAADRIEPGAAGVETHERPLEGR